MKLDRSIAVLFQNRARDALILYLLDANGDRCLTKRLDRGAFLLPVPAAGQKYVVLDPRRLGAERSAGAPATGQRAPGVVHPHARAYSA